MQVDFKSLPPSFIASFKFGADIHATDIFIKENYLPFFSSVLAKGIALNEQFKNFYLQRYNNKADEYNQLIRILKRPVNLTEIKAFLQSLNAGITYERFMIDSKELNLAVEITQDGKPKLRFRLNICKAEGRITLTFRRLFNVILEPTKLGLPADVIRRVLRFNSGLIIIAGPTGSGKSTTLASMLDQINKNSEKVIVTIENPIEYKIPQAKSFIIQREVGNDTPNIISGIENALRQNPDIIVVGEARTNEEIEGALRAAETGHLTFMTLHTTSVVDSIKRIVDSFGGTDAVRIKLMLASQLRAIIIQRLAKSVNGRPRPVLEYLILDNEAKAAQIRKLIEERKENQIADFINQPNSEFGKSMNRYLLSLITDGIITPDQAIKVSYDPISLEEMLAKRKV